MDNKKDNLIAAPWQEPSQAAAPQGSALQAIDAQGYAPSQPAATPAEAAKKRETQYQELEKRLSKSSIERLRTYQGDVATAIQKNNGSVAKIALAEVKKQQRKEDAREAASPSSPKNLIIIIASMILLLGGTGFISYPYVLKFLSATTAVPAAPSQLDQRKRIILTDNQLLMTISDSGDLASQLRTMVRSGAKGAIGTVAEIGFSNAAGSVGQAKARDFLSALAPHIPASLLSAVSSDFLFGVRFSEVPQPFLILKTDFYQSAFAGMLEWEQNMLSDIGPVFLMQNLNDAELGALKFRDTVIENRDARIVSDSGGNILFLYAFLDQNTLLMASSQATLHEILTRYQSARLIR